MSILHVFKAAFCICGESECATGSPKTPRRTGGSILSHFRKSARVKTRFPPEPNGYLHIGHAKSICLNFGIAHEFNGICNVRMDDTNPTKEETEYVDSIMEDVHWLVDGWGDKNLGGAPLYTSDYFDRLYQFALELIDKGKAYVDDMTAEETDEFRRLGKESRFRNRSSEENRDLYERMKTS